MLFLHTVHKVGEMSADSDKPSEAEEQLYDKKKLELTGLLGGDLHGRGIDDRQLPNGQFPIPCIEHYDFYGAMKKKEAELNIDIQNNRVNDYLDKFDSFERTYGFMMPPNERSPQRAYSNINLSPAHTISQSEASLYETMRKRLGPINGY